MKAKAFGLIPGFLLPFVLVLAAAWITLTVLAGKTLPLINSPRAALWGLLILGMAACSGGIGQVGASNRWASPLAILGYLLGAAILVVFAAGLSGWQLPLVQTQTQALVAVSALMVVKLVIGAVGYFFRLL